MLHLLEHINQDIKGDKAKKRTQQYFKLNTRAKEIQYANPGGPKHISTGKEPSILERYTAIEKHMQILKDAQESDDPKVPNVYIKTSEDQKATNTSSFEEDVKDI